MAHFAKLDDNNNVIDVVTISNESIDPLNEESSGIAFLTEWSNGYTNWKQTSYTAKIRFNYAGIGYIYDPIDDAFIAPPICDHKELILNDKKQWECANDQHPKIV